MWLDRFSTQSTPADSPPPPRNRNYSPDPRRTTHLSPGQRPGLGLTAGGSSLSLGLSSNGSAVSLPTVSRMPNGSSLRQEHRPSPSVPDSLKVLRSILGISSQQASEVLESDEGRNREKPTHFNPDIDFGDLSLEDYAQRQDEPPKSPPPLTPLQPTFTEEQRKYRGLHDAIEGCDEVLKSVESYLTNFQNELGAVSAEIGSLQTRSTQLSSKLENRKKVEKLLGPAVEDISISPATVRTIAEGPVDESWIAALDELETRSATVEKNSVGSVKATEDVRPLLENLKAKAIERIRDFAVAQIKALRSPNINAQILQQRTFIKFKNLFTFLARHNPVLAEEIGQAYINTMKWYYTSSFTRYQQALEKLQLYTLEPTEVLGADPVPSRRNAGHKTKAAPPQHDVFSLGRRSDILQAKSRNAISAYVAEDDKSYHHLETPFYNFNLALIDNASSEYTVLTCLFATQSFHSVSRKVHEIFEPSFTLGHTLTKHLIDSSTDCFGVLLCVRINQHFAFELQRRKVPVADSYINGTNMLLWPRFQIIMDLHCESLKRVTAPTARGAAAAFSLVGNNSHFTNDSSKTSIAPHPTTQRFGQFLHGILALSSDAGDDEPVSNSLGRLRGEFEALMARLAKGTGDATKRSRFLYYNYSLVLTIIGDAKGKLAEEQRVHFEGLEGGHKVERERK